MKPISESRLLEPRTPVVNVENEASVEDADLRYFYGQVLPVQVDDH